jgi:heme/copper-type cytochrome/quinol oxidase subunit 3
MMHTLFLLMEIFMFGTATLGMMLARSLAHKVQPAQRVLQVQQVQLVHLVILQLSLQLRHHLQLLVMRGLTQLMEKFMSTTIHTGLRLVRLL